MKVVDSKESSGGIVPSKLKPGSSLGAFRMELVFGFPLGLLLGLMVGSRSLAMLIASLSASDGRGCRV